MVSCACRIWRISAVYQQVRSIGQGRNQIVLVDHQLEVTTDLFSEDFLKSDPCDTLIRWQCKKLMDLLLQLKRTRHIQEWERKKLIPAQPYAGVLPKFYVLPKTHKLGPLKVRPIISNCGLYCDAVMIKLKAILNCLIWGTLR